MEFIKKQIELNDTIIIHGHKKPDGDCYGSQFGLKDIIMTTYPNKKVYVVGEEEPKLSFLGIKDQITDDTYKEALVFVVDCGQSSVISDLRYKLGKMIIRIDHHLFIEKIGEYEWIDSNFASCSEMIYHFKEYHNLKLTKKGALPIYTGIVTDTGHFRFERVNSNTFKIGASLLEYDLDVFEIDQKINFKSLGLLKFQGYVCNNCVAEEGLIYFKFSEQIIKQFNINIEQAFSILNMLSYVENNPVWAFILELPNGSWKLSIRTQGPEISDIAHQFGGGGHKKACGVIVDTIEKLNEVVKLIKDSIKKFNLENNKK
ncbi:bifunctional oligoribonuclease/PAP phosphatase NrnA [Candidatus Phytoplasma ziziphi]|uniref:Bifunctional oligoribonuclease/PAP phosphatase NrnA n=1 Tax=Ziziphus jujuba witches'-broom phytoplasma TaxID=135727 RepID=A0A660HMG7_ZIZJU|nr:bifunctional oligoribonuclease/PAP phosphatase NrnA [Candidatus Phytoplasma ziziphi]AYJ01227.1 bifunctional oligoribonuclease/PAP phosphatase NrnA [Candidatus Phytoplasma ziziphi]